jgi:superfamily II DNA or RNA helicase
MACGTGKTLVRLWAHEQLESHCTLVLVPSLFLVALDRSTNARGLGPPSNRYSSHEGFLMSAAGEARPHHGFTA